MINKYGEYFDSAHNEYIQYLLTIGPIGLGSYLVFLISSARSLMKKVNAVPSLYGVALALICYGFQASVNINLPAVTPTLWLLISLGAAGLRNKTTE
jgi:O-antigen ligase